MLYTQRPIQHSCFAIGGCPRYITWGIKSAQHSYSPVYSQQYNTNQTSRKNVATPIAIPCVSQAILIMVLEATQQGTVKRHSVAGFFWLQSHSLNNALPTHFQCILHLDFNCENWQHPVGSALFSVCNCSRHVAFIYTEVFSKALKTNMHCIGLLTAAFWFLWLLYHWGIYSTIDLRKMAAPVENIRL